MDEVVEISITVVAFSVNREEVFAIRFVYSPCESCGYHASFEGLPGTVELNTWFLPLGES